MDKGKRAARAPFGGASAELAGGEGGSPPSSSSHETVCGIVCCGATLCGVCTRQLHRPSLLRPQPLPGAAKAPIHSVARWTRCLALRVHLVCTAALLGASMAIILSVALYFTPAATLEHRWDFTSALTTTTTTATSSIRAAQHRGVRMTLSCSAARCNYCQNGGTCRPMDRCALSDSRRIRVPRIELTSSAFVTEVGSALSLSHTGHSSVSAAPGVALDGTSEYVDLELAARSMELGSPARAAHATTLWNALGDDSTWLTSLPETTAVVGSSAADNGTVGDRARETRKSCPPQHASPMSGLVPVVRTHHLAVIVVSALASLAAASGVRGAQSALRRNRQSTYHVSVSSHARCVGL